MAPLRARAAHSSRLVAADRRGVAELAAAVAKTHDAGLLRFLALAVPEWLPVERRLQRADRVAGRGGHCKLCRRGAGEVPLSETVRHLYVCECPDMRAALERSVVDGCTALVAAGVSIRGPCRLPPETLSALGSGPVPPVGELRWVPVWFDPRRLFWMEVVVRVEGHVIDYGRRDPLGAVFGVLPKHLDSLLAWSRTVDGWARRSLKAQEELRGRLQVLLLRGAWQVYRVRCRLMADWWREPAQAPSRDCLAQSVAGRAMRRARSYQNLNGPGA